MKFLWMDDGYQSNERAVFKLENVKPCDTLTVCAADFFRVFLDGKMSSFGPERTAAGFIRPRTISVSGVKNIEIEVAGYNECCYACDFQKPFFGAELKKGDEVVYGSEDFSCVTKNSFVNTTTRYSGQRGFVEITDFHKLGETPRKVMEVDAPKIIGALGDFADYREIPIHFIKKSAFFGFEKHDKSYSETRPNYVLPLGAIDPMELKRRFESGEYLSYDYKFDTISTGFIGLKIKAEDECEVVAVMDEYLPEGEWRTFRRSGTNDFLMISAPKGEWEFLSFEPYAFKYLKILIKGKAEVVPSFIALDNAKPSCVKVSGNEKFKKIFDAAERTFRQNVLDIFMDCPSRERAGWLCDSFFTAKTERLFFGNNDIERAFLENILISTTEELDPRMLPKCFPAQHKENHYIPNWAMWFVVELNDYFHRTGDRTLVDMAKKRVYDLISFFDKYVNEFGLLEDLESWVFIEWSICNTPEYIKGVNFPSNMLFAYMLGKAAELYDDNALKTRSQNMLETASILSYNGTFYVDNAVRNEKGELVLVNEHTSETCQYYALFMGLCPDEEFKERMVKEFGPLRNGTYPSVGKSNMFIGNYLRFLWLCDIGEYDRVVNECLEYFAIMAEKTGTLWEHDSPHASCNHGFASVAAVILLRCVCGYVGVKDGKPIFEKDFKASKDYGVNIEFNYNK